MPLNCNLYVVGANETLYGIVGGGFGLAVGAALAARFQKTGAITVVFFGDGASNRGTFHEAANMAAAWRLWHMNRGIPEAAWR